MPTPLKGGLHVPRWEPALSLGHSSRHRVGFIPLAPCCFALAWLQVGAEAAVMGQGQPPGRGRAQEEGRAVGKHQLQL